MYDTVVIDTCHTFSQSLRMHSNEERYKVNCVLWVIVMCQYQLINSINVPLWWSICMMGERLHVLGGAHSIWETSVPSSQFC